MLTPKKNLLLEKTSTDFFPIAAAAPTAREIRRKNRVATAVEAVGDFSRGGSVFGVTKGRFSLIELIAALLSMTGPTDFLMSVWSVSINDLTDMEILLNRGFIKNARIVVDYTLNTRKPLSAARLIDIFGAESIRAIPNHSKFVLFRNDQWDVVLKTSMNLNFNPRLEDFDIQDDKRLADFLENLMNEIFKRRKSSDIMDACAVNEKRFEKL